MHANIEFALFLEGADRITEHGRKLVLGAEFRGGVAQNRFHLRAVLESKLVDLVVDFFRDEVSYGVSQQGGGPHESFPSKFGPELRPKRGLCINPQALISILIPLGVAILVDAS